MPPPAFLAYRSAVVLAGIALLCSRVYADTLIFADGNRVTGKLLKLEADEITFRSVRFGEIRVGRSQAVVEVDAGAPTEPPTPAASPASVTVPAPDTPQRTRLKWWQPWTGRVAFSTEVIQDSSNHKAVMVEGRVERIGKSDQLRSEWQYEYRQQDDRRQTDDLKANVRWKHLLPHRLFSVYQPSVEWNRTAWYKGAFTPYVVVQQEFGVGYALLDTPTRKLSAGVGEEVFEGWALNSSDRIRDHEEAAIVESEFKLPFQAKLTNRVVLYHSFATGKNGLENSMELTRRLTESLSIGVQQQYQHHLPDVRLQNYRRVRMLIGLEF